MSRFTETVERHAMDGYLDGRWYCRCDWSCCAVDRNAALTAHAAHVESMLVEAGVVAVELPEDAERAMRYENLAVTHRTDGVPPIRLRTPELLSHFAPEIAVRKAAALLAAAAAAAAVRPVTPEEPK